MNRFLKEWFKSQRPEESRALRGLALGVTWWAGLALASVGTPLWVWAGAPLMASLGHLVSWRNRAGGPRWLGPIVLSAVLGLTLPLAVDVRSALNGNWLPPAR